MNNTRSETDIADLGPLLILFFITSCILILRTLVVHNFQRLYEPLP